MRENHLHRLYQKLEGLSGIVNDRGCVTDRHSQPAPYCQQMPHESVCEGVARPMGSDWGPRARAWQILCKSSRAQETNLLGDSKNSWMGYRGRNRPPGLLLCLQPPRSRTMGYSNAPEREQKMSAKQGNPWLDEVRNQIALVADSAHFCGYQPEWLRVLGLTGTNHDLCGLLWYGYCHLRMPSTTTCYLDLPS
jgi:hypothetical protein